MEFFSEKSAERFIAEKYGSTGNVTQDNKNNVIQGLKTYYQKQVNCSASEIKKQMSEINRDVVNYVNNLLIENGEV